MKEELIIRPDHVNEMRAVSSGGSGSVVSVGQAWGNALYQALRRLGDVFAQQSAHDEALSILVLALEGFTRMDVHQSRAECMRTLGDIHFRRGALCSDGEMWAAARPPPERSEQRKAIIGIDERLQTLIIADKLESVPTIEMLTPQSLFHSSAAEIQREKPEPVEGVPINI
ncbi:hypothetical protein B0H14DRAFT_2586733 [Mycena olivaceomarginata]|nr:hypothetical protein B0H14DRAFT_2586733 [Mycena olivaceomarginata]